MIYTGRMNNVNNMKTLYSLIRLPIVISSLIVRLVGLPFIFLICLIEFPNYEDFKDNLISWFED